jgi:excisionase family DNA binding protein
MKTSDDSNAQSLAQHIENWGRALTAPELAALLSVHVLTIYRLAKSGHIPCYRIGSSLRFDPRRVAQYLREHEVRR